MYDVSRRWLILVYLHLLISETYCFFVQTCYSQFHESV